MDDQKRQKKRNGETEASKAGENRENDRALQGETAGR